ncbi:uncharacterized protein CLAFUR5_09121 [Fulvia fulva]|uniref:Uncharacterized protein n=1 Tax=Passalora fulva TaxID=5499 RepID=A0A9Q8UT75_PASFU|nr:uncharacterized protein CLAFUR5_09121 [Fulvia fulva]UJO21522.1 hypothetical protein CLAFUR5_09121 [Fulvia fulva]
MATLLDTQTETSSPMQTPTSTEAGAPPQRDEVTQTKKRQFADLSKEIKELIIERVIRPSDLKNACLVSKEFHEIAVRFLYRNVALDLGGAADNKLSAFLNQKNIGLKHIRQLRLYHANVHNSPSYDQCKEQQAQFASRMVLEFLPEDILEEFRYDRKRPQTDDEEEDWCPWRPFSADNLMLLYRKQRKMKWLEVMDLDRPILPDIKKNPKIQDTMFKSARKLALYPENRDTLNFSGFCVEKTKENLEELIVHCNFSSLESGNSIDTRELNDSATAPGLVSGTIFSCMTPFDKCEPFKKLTSLRLHRISLRHCADTWCKFINFHELKYLRLYHCSGADTLFDQLCRASHLPKQLKVLEFQHRDNDENEALIALDGFLCLVSGLRDLVIDLEHVKQLPAAAGIVRHGKTLELLNVHCTSSNPPSRITSESDNDELVWDVDDFEKICKACKTLEQLSCAWPSTSLIRSPSEEWKAYENACGNLKHMVTLHISTWPSNKPSTQLLPRSIYEVMLQALAQRGFELAAGTHPSSPSGTSDHEDEDESDKIVTEPIPPAKLRLIAFGTSDKIYEREDSKNQIIYIKSTCMDAEGKPKVYAAPVGWCSRQYVEPRSEVLDFVLHQSDRSNKPPCREQRETSAWGDDDE